MIVLYADKNQLTVREKEPITSGSVNVYPVRFEFSEDWDGLDRTAVFQAGCVEKAVALTGGACTIPPEVLGVSGHFLMAGVYGKLGATVALPTIWANLGLILEGAVPGEDPDTPEPVPPPDGWQEALDSKGDNLSLEGKSLSLRSGEKVLSTVELPTGGGEGGPGEPGKDGATFIPSVSEDGTLSWTNDGGLPNPDPVDIKGPSGKDGAPGQKGDPGETGPQGEKGADATINGVNALELAAGDNIVMDQQGDRLTISSTGGGNTTQSPITAGDGLSKDGATLNVDNPVRGIMTMAEFDALPEEEKAGGTYFVDDGGGSGGGSSWDTYSTEEQRIGTWIDGKPLYRITGSTTTPKIMNIWTDVAMDPLKEVDQMLLINSSLDVDYENILIFGGNASVSLGWNKLTKKICIYNIYKTTADRPLLFTLYYTKTTDPEASA